MIVYRDSEVICNSTALDTSLSISHSLNYRGSELLSIVIHVVYTTWSFTSFLELSVLLYFYSHAKHLHSMTIIWDKERRLLICERCKTEISLLSIKAHLKNHEINDITDTISSLSIDQAISSTNTKNRAYAESQELSSLLKIFESFVCNADECDYAARKEFFIKQHIKTHDFSTTNEFRFLSAKVSTLFRNSSHYFRVDNFLEKQKNNSSLIVLRQKVFGMQQNKNETLTRVTIEDVSYIFEFHRRFKWVQTFVETLMSSLCVIVAATHEKNSFIFNHVISAVDEIFKQRAIITE